MIDINGFKEFLLNTFSPDQLSIQEFKTDLIFIDIDCFPSQPYKLTIELSTEAIKISTIDRNVKLDFSLYQHNFESNLKAQTFIEETFRKGYFINP